jgi:polyisoprenoid-binding protein YceI
MKSALLVLSLLSTSTMATTITGTSEFTAKASPGFLEIEGKGAHVDGSKASIDKNNMLSGTFVVALAEFKTGIAQRDSHMFGYLETVKYPTAEFQLNPISAVGGIKKAFTGNLTLHGVTKPVSGTVDLSSTRAEAKFSIDVTQFGIKVPTYKLLTVGKDVDVTVLLELQ